jgi:hypothetical protein
MNTNLKTSEYPVFIHIIIFINIEISSNKYTLFGFVLQNKFEIILNKSSRFHLTN